MTTVDRLRVIYELDDARARSGFDRMRRQTRATNQEIIAGASKMEASVAKSFKGMSAGALSAATAVLSLGAAFAALNRYTNSYVTIENRLRSIGQFSDEAGEKLLAAANRSRTAVEDMSTATARIAKATEADFDTTLRRVETLNKLLTIGGSTTAERGSVMLQLSQALGSGVLQGDELRALREAAPVEVLDAIARAAGVTRGELKKMGEEGKLTSAIVIEALDSLAETADSKLKNAVMTTSDAFTILSNSATVFFGRLDEGLGSQQAFAQAMQGLAAWLSENADEAEEFGRSVVAAFDTLGDYLSELRSALEAMGVISEDAFRSDGVNTFGDDIMKVIEFMIELNAHIEASAETAKQAFFQLADAISRGFTAAINVVGGAVEHVVNTVLNGVKRVASAIDALTASAANINSKAPEWLQRGLGLRTEGTNLAAQVEGLGVKFRPYGTRSSTTGRNASGEALGDVYANTYTAVKDAATQGLEDVANEIGNRYNLNKGKRDIANNAPLVYGDLPPSPTPTTPSVPPDGGAASSARSGRKRRGGGGKGGGKPDDPLFAASDEDLRRLEREIQLLGKSTREQARMRMEWELLDEAKKRGLPVNDRLQAQISAQAEQFGTLTERLEQGKASYSQFEEGVKGIADAMSGALLAGESFREGFAQVLKGIASDILSSGIRNALLGQFQAMGGGGGGGFWHSLLNGIVGRGDKLTGALRLAGARANGGPVGSGASYLVGENGPEIFKPAISGSIISNRDIARQSGISGLHVTAEVLENGGLQIFVQDQAGQVVAKSAPKLINHSVSATQKSMNKSKFGWGI